MTHFVKIKDCYYKRLLSGEKLFEVRFNDRDYQVGDLLCINQVVSDTGLTRGLFDDMLVYYIKYIHSGYGMEKGYVVLGIEKAKEEDEKIL